jgi:16S rRNA A1518/A1519 N6-dimethyltransferase RsmA/KsgA/DIM1 with predicted DNA glycosylase/AP lyase activity
MESTTINIVNIVGHEFCVEPEDGQKVFEIIKKAFSENRKVKLSFLNVERITTAFLNNAIGQLYGSFSETEIKEKLSVEDISQSGLVSIKRVVDTAKLFYSDPDALQRSIDDILED